MKETETFVDDSVYANLAMWSSKRYFPPRRQSISFKVHVILLLLQIGKNARTRRLILVSNPRLPRVWISTTHFMLPRQLQVHRVWGRHLKKLQSNSLSTLSNHMMSLLWILLPHLKHFWFPISTSSFQHLKSKMADINLLEVVHDNLPVLAELQELMSILSQSEASSSISNVVLDLELLFV